MPLRAPYTRGDTGETSRICCRRKVFLRHRLQEPEVYRLPPIASVSPDASNRSTGQAGSGMQVLSKLRQSCVSFQTVSIHLAPSSKDCALTYQFLLLVLICPLVATAQTAPVPAVTSHTPPRISHANLALALTQTASTSTETANRKGSTTKSG